MKHGPIELLDCSLFRVPWWLCFWFCSLSSDIAGMLLVLEISELFKLNCVEIYESHVWIQLENKFVNVELISQINWIKGLNYCNRLHVGMSLVKWSTAEWKVKPCVYIKVGIVKWEERLSQRCYLITIHVDTVWRRQWFFNTFAGKILLRSEW